MKHSFGWDIPDRPKERVLVLVDSDWSGEATVVHLEHDTDGFALKRREYTIPGALLNAIAIGRMEDLRDNIQKLAEKVGLKLFPPV